MVNVFFLFQKHFSEEILSSAYPTMAKEDDDDSWVNDPRSHRMSSLKMSLSIMSTFVKWEFYELIFSIAHFLKSWAHGIVSSQFLVKWVPAPMVWMN